MSRKSCRLAYLCSSVPSQWIRSICCCRLRSRGQRWWLSFYSAAWRWRSGRFRAGWDLLGLAAGPLGSASGWRMAEGQRLERRAGSRWSGQDQLWGKHLGRYWLVGGHLTINYKIAWSDLATPPHSQWTSSSLSLTVARHLLQKKYCTVFMTCHSPKEKTRFANQNWIWLKKWLWKCPLGGKVLRA